MDPNLEGATGEDRVGARPKPPDSDGRELVASILRHDRKAAARLVAGHIDAIYAFVRYRLAPRADLVDDVVQDVFLGALSGLETFHGQSTLRTWLLGIARHKIEDVYRQRLRTPDPLDVDALEDESIAATSAIEEQIDTSRACDKAQRVLGQLPERYGLLLLWRYWEQRSAGDIAGALGTTVKSVERMLARARARFKDLWLKE